MSDTRANEGGEAVSDVHELLLNWSRWVRLRPHQGHCFSIEHRYKLRRVDDTVYGWGSWNTTPPSSPLPAVDSLSALEVERVMRFLPRKHRLALKLEYVFRMPWKMACKRLSLPYNLWWEHLSQAQQMVANRLTRRGKGYIRPPQFDLPASAETLAADAAGGVCEAV